MVKMKGIVNFILGFGLVFLLSNCKKNDGSVEIKKVELSAFREIELNDAFDVVLFQDSVFSIQIEANEKFIDAVEYTVQDSILKVDYASGKRWRNPETNKVKLVIRGDRPRKLQANESCFIQTGNKIVSDEFGLVLFGKLNQADLELGGRIFYYWNNHPCGGKVKLTGKVDQLKLWNFAIMQVDASNCESRYGLVENYSKGECKIHITEKLDYSLVGEGNIILNGNPELQLLQENSSGILIFE
jgi:hypothetical protein